MEADETRRGRLTDLEQVPDISSRVSQAHVAGTRCVEGFVAVDVLCTLDVQLALVGECRSMTADSGLHHAVELVDTEVDRFDQ